MITTCHRLNGQPTKTEYKITKEVIMPNPIPQLEIITGKELLAQPITPLEYTIDAILPHGLFILAGSSKIGKSWLALDMSCAVAGGGSLWQYPATQGEVLYLALEDNHKRLQERLNKVSPICEPDASANIHFVTKAKKLGGGLAEQLTTFLDEHPQTNLIVVDTLQYIRNTGKFTGTYSGDYHDMDALREIISGRNLTMLLITHNHKSDESDPVNRVIGSTGLTGAVDGIFVLEKIRRIGDAARLTIANRDTESHQFELHFDRQDCRWQFITEAGADEDDGRDDDLLFVMLDCLLDETPTWSGTATGLSKTLNLLDSAVSISPISLSKTLRTKHKFLLEQYGIVCKFDRSNKKRFIELSRVIIVAEYENVKQEPPRLVV